MARPGLPGLPGLEKGPGKGLGKGLGDLMKGPPAAASGQTAKLPAEMGRGLSRLITVPQTAPEEISPRKVLVPTWFFFAADILLLAFAGAICFEAPKPMPWGTMFFCGSSITMGAFLALTGVLRNGA